MRDEREVRGMMYEKAYADATHVYHVFANPAEYEGGYTECDEEQLWALVAWYVTKYPDDETADDETERIVYEVGRCIIASGMRREGLSKAEIIHNLLENRPAIKVTLSEDGHTFGVEGVWGRDVEGMVIRETTRDTGDGHVTRVVAATPDLWGRLHRHG